MKKHSKTDKSLEWKVNEQNEYVFIDKIFDNNMFVVIKQKKFT